MWKRKALKKNTRGLLKRSYWRMIAVCFLTAMLTTAYAVSTTFLNLQFSAHPHYTDAAFSTGIPNSEVIEETIRHFLEHTPMIRLLQSGAFDITSLLVDLYSTNFSVFFSSLRAANAFLTESFSLTVFFPLAGLILAVLYQIFVSNLLIIGEKRYFLENRNYRQTTISKVFFLYRLRCIINPAWIMFCRSVFQMLWNLTIVGGIIKHYEYILIPFILAENPKIDRKDAFFLSRQLMQHNKWRYFLLDLSFIGWRALSLLTLGLLDFLYVNPYISGVTAELYAILRRNYVLSRSPRYEHLSDSFLEHVPSEDELLISKALYDDSQGPYTKISYFAPEQYPVFLFSVQPPEKAVRPPLKADRKYAPGACIFLFFAFSFLGWILETSIHLMRDGSLLKNTVLFGPWLPIYGLYGTLALLLLRRFLKKPVQVFVLCTALYSVLEYVFNSVYELITHSALRDYSEYFLNFNGRIYPGGSVAFGLLGCAFLYYLAPRWSEIFMKRQKAVRILINSSLCILFAADIAVSVLPLFQ